MPSPAAARKPASTSSSASASASAAPTWPQANRLRKVAAELPAEAIVLETDAPDMAPSMYPGQRNSPEHLPDICRALAELRGVDAEELAASSSRNAAELFGWD